MTARTAIDWAAKPPPWCWIGPKLRAECEAILGGVPLPPSSPPRSDIYRRRMALGLRQDDLANLAGVSRNTVWSAETGTKGKRSGRRAFSMIEAALDAAEAAQRDKQP